jgi:DNA polymerase II large subunit
MKIEEYSSALNRSFALAYEIASLARAKGYDPEKAVEIKPAPDLASRVEGIIGIEGLAELIKRRMAPGKSSESLAFEVIKEICESPRFAAMEVEEKMTTCVRVGLAIVTEGVLVAPTEGIQRVKLHMGPDGADYVAVVYAGPIRGAGGTSAALSVTMADCTRKLLGIGPYKAQPSEVDRSIEDIQIYHARVARLQYFPSEDDIRSILENCPVCIDGVPTEKIEVSMHRNLKRLDSAGKEEWVTNKVRGSLGLVICEGIAQKAKSVIMHAKNAGLDWSWLNKVIKADKPSKGSGSQEKSRAVFLQELVAGRPILAYPDTRGSFRLRYGRSRLTGIAAKGFSPASMAILGEFIAVGTQLKLEKPGKGCVAAPVDSIEGPFVKLADGRALRVNSAEAAWELKDRVSKIIAVGDILISYGDFKKSNTALMQPSYVEEYWSAQLSATGCGEKSDGTPSFREAVRLSQRYGVPMHPRYIYDYYDVSAGELAALRVRLGTCRVEPSTDSIFSIRKIEIDKLGAGETDTAKTLEKLCVPHLEKSDSVEIESDDAQSILVSLGMSDGELLEKSRPFVFEKEQGALEIVNSNAPFKIMRRSVRIGARIGRPEKAKERLMKPAPNVLFPVGENGGKERNVSKAYDNAKRKFRSGGIEVEIARYRCAKGSELCYTPFCHRHNSPASMEFVCPSCGTTKAGGQKCAQCGSTATASDTRSIDIIGDLDTAAKRLGVGALPTPIKGVKGLLSTNKSTEPLEKGILRAVAGVHIFKDGTSRFDATDVPMTHFYPAEIGVPVEKLRQLGYEKDYIGADLVDEGQLVELMHQDVILNNDGARHMLAVARFIDELLVRHYGMKPFYNAEKIDDLLGHLVITLAPHTSAGVMCRIIGFTEAYVGFAHPYIICARRRNCDGDEDTTMLLLDALVNFSKSYLPASVGGTMDAPLILTVNVDPKEVDNEVHAMEICRGYGIEFYAAAERNAPPGEAKLELVKDRLGTPNAYSNIMFTHLSGPGAVAGSPKKSMYTKLNTMSEKIAAQFRLTDMLECVDRPDAAKNLILSHFIPDLIGNMHSFSRQGFRCVACNSKYRRVPLVGKCTRCHGKIVLTISKSSIEKYLEIATTLAERYALEPYIRQRLALIRDEIENVFGYSGTMESNRQVNLSKFM